MVKSVENLVDIDVSRPGNEVALLSYIKELKALVERQAETIKCQGEAIERQARTIKILQKALFGQKSEKIIDDDERQGVFEEILREVDELNPDSLPVVPEARNETKSFVKPRRERRNLQGLIPEDLPSEEIIIDLPADKKIADDGTELKKIGEDRVEKLAFKPGYYFLKVFIYPKYANPANALEKVKRAPAPDFAVPGGSFDESFYAHLIYCK